MTNRSGGLVCLAGFLPDRADRHRRDGSSDALDDFQSLLWEIDVSVC
jgi:hypothetical protein